MTKDVHTDMLYLLVCEVNGDGLCGGGLVTPLNLMAERLDEDKCGCIEEAGVEAPYTELRVEEDLVVGTVPLLDPLESELSEDLSVLKLALERRRNSLKKGIVLANRVTNRVGVFALGGGR